MRASVVGAAALAAALVAGCALDEEGEAGDAALAGGQDASGAHVADGAADAEESDEAAPDAELIDEVPDGAVVDAPAPDEQDAAEPDAAEPDASPPELACAGRYRLTSWVVTEAGFDVRSFNAFLASTIADGSLVVAADLDEETLAFTQLGPDGQPLAGVAPGMPLGIDISPDGDITTDLPGTLSLHIVGEIAHYDVDLVATFGDAAFAGQLGADCAIADGTLVAAFGAAGLSLPAPPDYDADRDGVLESFLISGTFELARD